MNQRKARIHLLKTVRLVVAGLEGIGLPPLKSRDPREPARDNKQEYENDMRSAIVRYFGRMRSNLRRTLEAQYPDRKSLDYGGIPFTDEALIAELMKVLQKAAVNGVELFSGMNNLQIDWTMTNKKALEWARNHTYELVELIYKDVGIILQSAISQFIETVGMTIGDVMDLLVGLDERKAEQIAVTEITRTYAQATQMAGDDLKAEFPGVKVIKIWYTNNDELVCELCGPLDNTEVEIDEPFYDPEPPWADGDPPRHPNCRCWIETTTALAED